MDRRTRTRASLALVLFGGPLLVGVACTQTLQGTISIVTGPDDGFAENPKPTSLLIAFLGIDGGPAVEAGRVSLPASTGLTLPSQPGANIESLVITGFDSDGGVVVSGSTIPLALDQLAGITLNVFVQRTGQFSRLPSGDGGTAFLSTGIGTGPLLTDLYSRYLLISDGTGKSKDSQLYDTLTWQVLPQPPSLAIPPLSMAYIANYTGTDSGIEGGVTAATGLLTIGAGGQANWLNLTASAGTTVDAEVFVDAIAPPIGTGANAVSADLSNVAGGQTIIAPPSNANQNTYIVGATRRTGKPTTGVLRISPTGVVSWVELATQRLGAAAVFVNNGINSGLYVFGGEQPSDAGAGDGGAPTGVEFVSDNAATVTNVAISDGLPADTTTGAAALAFNDQTILLAGGVTADGKAAPVRFYSARILGGGNADASTTWPSLPVTYVTTQLFFVSDFSTSSSGYAAIVVGTEKSGLTSAYLMTPAAITPLAFRATRTNGAAAVLPNNALVVVGGDSGTLESFIP